MILPNIIRFHARVWRLHNIEDSGGFAWSQAAWIRRREILESSQFRCAASTGVTENNPEARPIAA
jgi:hypothetical protein